MRTNRTYSVDTTVLGGFPVRVGFSVDPPDPSVGVFTGAIVDVELRSVKTDKPYGEWLYKRIDAKKGEWDRLHERLGDDRDEGY